MSLATRKKHIYFSILMILLVMGFFVTPVSAAVKKVPYLNLEKKQVKQLNEHLYGKVIK